MALKRAMVGVMDAEARCMGPVSAQMKASRAENIFAKFLRFLDEMVGMSGFKGLFTEESDDFLSVRNAYQVIVDYINTGKQYAESANTQETFDDL